jgi:NAD(P)-dependent dehydrogenase (short-subunit alcohol dehydrogenase family)
MSKFANKRVLVTGSTQGIGRGAAEMFHELGAIVAINGRKGEDVEAVIKEMGTDRLVGAPGDLGTVRGCRSVVDLAIDRLGGLDCLVNNAGICPLSRMMDVSEQHWDRVMGVNLRSALFTTQFALPELRRSQGNIVFVGSLAGLLAGPVDNFVYAISKGGLISMTKSLALEVARDNVRINCVCPGYIDTPMVQAENAATNGQCYEFIRKSTPLGRIGTVRECAAAIVYLGSDDASYITGSILSDDGGCTANGSWGGANYEDVG